MDITEVLRNITPEEIEKFRMIASIFGGKGQVKQVNLEMFYKEYLSYAEFNLAPKTVGIVKLAFKHLLSFFPGTKSVDEIGLREVELFIRSLQNKTSKGYRVYYRTLKAAFNKGIDWGYLVTSPWIKVKLPKVQRNEPVVIDSGQLAVISKQIENETVKEMVIFGFNTGCRLGEITNLTWNNVDLNKRLIMIGDKNFSTKGRKQRVIPMNDEVYEMLVSKVPKVFKVNKEMNFVFAKANRMSYTADAVSKAFKKAARKCGLSEDIHFHSLRHSFATGLAQRNIPVPVIQKLMGHSDIKTSMVYIKTDLESMREAVNRL